MNKDLIRLRFSRNLATYSENASIQKKMAKRLFSFVEEKETGEILEIGCGTGFLTKIINENIDFKSYTAVDIVPECLNFIEKINPRINFIPDDIENFILHSDKKYDLIVSNASLQWVENFENTAINLVSKLKEGGSFVFSTFGIENYREITFVTGNKLKYYSKSELYNIFSKYKVIFDEEVHILSFQSPKEILKHLHLTGVNAIESQKWTKKDMQRFEMEYNNFCSNHPTLTYNPCYVKIKL